MVALPLLCHSTMMPCFYDVPGFLCKLSWLWGPQSCYFRLSFHSQSSLSQFSEPHFPALNSLYTRRHTTHSGVLRAKAQIMHAFLTLFCLPLIPQSSLSAPADLSTFSECGNLSSPSASRQDCWPVFFIPFLFFFLWSYPVVSAFFLSFKVSRVFH